MVANMKNKQIWKKIDQQASHRLKPCPPRLEGLLGVINLVPSEIELPDLETMSRENLKRLYDEMPAIQSDKGRPATTGDAIEYAQRAVDKASRSLAVAKRANDEIGQASHLLQAIEICLEGLPPAFCRYVKQDPPGWRHGDEDKPYRMLYRYNLVRDARENISRIISRYKQYKPDLSMPVFTVTTTIRISNDGLIEFERDDFMRAIEGVEVERLRRCAICSKFFWAGRLDQQCCSKNCANTLRNRRWRANSKEYYATRVLKENNPQANQDSKKER